MVWYNPFSWGSSQDEDSAEAEDNDVVIDTGGPVNADDISEWNEAVVADDELPPWLLEDEDENDQQPLARGSRTPGDGVVMGSDGVAYQGQGMSADDVNRAIQGGSSGHEAAGVQTTGSNAQSGAQADGAGASQEEGHWWNNFTSWCGRQWDGFSSWCGRQADAVVGVFSSDDKPQEAGVQTTSSNAQGGAQTDGASASQEEGHWWDNFTSWCGRQWDDFSSWCGRQADAIAGVFSSDDKPQEAGGQTTSSNAQGEAQAEGANAKPAETRGVTSTGYVQTAAQQWATHGRELKGDTIVVAGVTVDEMRKSGSFTEKEIYEVYARAKSRLERASQNPDVARRLAANGEQIQMTGAELGISNRQVAVLQKLGRED